MSYVENSMPGCKYTSSFWTLTETQPAPNGRIHTRSKTSATKTLTCQLSVLELNIFAERRMSTSTTAPLSSEIWSVWSRLRNTVKCFAILTSRRTEVSAMLRNSTFDGESIGCRSIGLSNDIWKDRITSCSISRHHGDMLSMLVGSTTDAIM